jgi:DNA-directed RNA polymerase subunit RPC12/RpoP
MAKDEHNQRPDYDRDTCSKCKKRPVEIIDGERQMQCIACNDKDIEAYRESADFEHWHRED